MDRPRVLERQRIAPRHLRLVRAGDRLPLPPPEPPAPPAARPRRRVGAAVAVLAASLTLAGLVAWAARSWR